MKLISLNVEGERHYERILPFIETETPDVLCLQEASASLLPHLHERGFETIFAPITLRPVPLPRVRPLSTIIYHGMKYNRLIFRMFIIYRERSS